MYEKDDKRYALDETNTNRLQKLFREIRKNRKTNEYDCILGVSGGRDSTYCLYLLKKHGLNPLAFHFDNNMDSKTAAENIKKACTKLDIDLQTYIVDWEEYKDLQRSFLFASVPSVDMPTDHAYATTLFRTAFGKKIKYVFNGGSFRTEGYIPSEWSLHHDEKFILDIQKKFGTKKMKKFPIRNFFDLIKFKALNITVVQPLNYISYVQSEVDTVLINELSWKYYGGHHFESIFTRWSFGYLLPVKFSIDKRITDYSQLIRSGQISREEAAKKMKEVIYSPEMEKEDRRYIFNKLELTNGDFDEIMQTPPKSNYFFDHQSRYMRKLYRVLSPKHF